MICVLAKKYGAPKIMFFPDGKLTAEFFGFMNSSSAEALEAYQIDGETVTKIYPTDEGEES